MITVLLDSSNTKLTVGLAEDKKLIDFISYEAWQQQSEYMIEELNKLLDKHNYTKNNIKDIIVAVGPGSYTGVRISITIAKVMALALNIPVYEVSSLRILKDGDEPSVCLINARSGRSYMGVYRGQEVIEPDTIKTNEEVVEYINSHDDYSIMGDVRYLGLEVIENNVCEEMISLKDALTPSPDCLAIKPIYMKD